MFFWQKFLSQGYIFLPKSLAKGVFLTKNPKNWHFGPKLASVFRKFLLKREYLCWNSLKSCKNGLMIRKVSLAKGMFSTKISLAKGIRSKTGAAHLVKIFFGVPPGACTCCWFYIWGLCCQKQVSQARISNYIPQFTVGCNYLSLPEIPASDNKVVIYWHHCCDMLLYMCMWLDCLMEKSGGKDLGWCADERHWTIGDSMVLMLNTAKVNEIWVYAMQN